MTKKDFSKILEILIPKAKIAINNKLNCNCTGDSSLFITTNNQKIKISKSKNSFNKYISISYYYLSKKGIPQEGYCYDVACYNKEGIDKVVDEIVIALERILKEDRQEIWEVYNKGAYTNEYEL